MYASFTLRTCIGISIISEFWPLEELKSLQYMEIVRNCSKQLKNSRFLKLASQPQPEPQPRCNNESNPR